MKTIKIEVYGGCVTEVTGLPEGYDYEIIDYDHLEEQQAASLTSLKPHGNYRIIKEKENDSD